MHMNDRKYLEKVNFLKMSFRYIFKKLHLCIQSLNPDLRGRRTIEQHLFFFIVYRCKDKINR